MAWGVVPCLRAVAFLDAVGYLSFCSLLITSMQSGHSPMFSDWKKAFSTRDLLLTGYFLVVIPFSVNPGNGCVEKSSRSAFSVIDQYGLCPLIFLSFQGCEVL